MISDQINDKRSNIRKELFTLWTKLTTHGASVRTGQFENWHVSYERHCLQVHHKEILIAEIKNGNVFLHKSIEEPYQLPLHSIKETILLIE